MLVLINATPMCWAIGTLALHFSFLQDARHRSRIFYAMQIGVGWHPKE